MTKKKQTLREQLAQDLLDQLERNGTIGSYYEDMIADWLILWNNKKELIADLQERGSKVQKWDSKGQLQIVNNESSELLIKVSIQMQKTLDFLGLKPPTIKGVPVEVTTDEDM